MRAAQHKQRAEKLLDHATGACRDSARTYYVAAAHVHAILASIPDPYVIDDRQENTP